MNPNMRTKGYESFYMNHKSADNTYILSLHKQRNCILVQLATYCSSELETTKNRNMLAIEMIKGSELSRQSFFEKSISVQNNKEKELQGEQCER